MAWIDNYLTGIDEIDLEHRELFEIIIKLKKLIKSKQVTRKKIVKIIKFLLNYTMFHFNSEEEYMKEINYKDIVIHKNIHKHFTDKIIEMLQDLKDKNDYDVMALYNYLIKWLKNHIAVEDQKYIVTSVNLKTSKVVITTEESIINNVISRLYHVEYMLDDNLINKKEYQIKRLQYIQSCIKSYKIDNLKNLIIFSNAISKLYERDLITREELQDIKVIINKSFNIPRKIRDEKDMDLKNHAQETLDSFLLN